MKNKGDAGEAGKYAQIIYQSWKVKNVRGRLERLFNKSSDVDAIDAAVEAVFDRTGLQFVSDN